MLDRIADQIVQDAVRMDALHPYETVIRQQLLESSVIHADKTACM
jgi:hypothetical protein